MPDLAPSPTPDTAVAATPSPAPAPVSNGTVPSTSDATTQTERSAPSEDNFTSVDVKTLSPELKGKYDSMLSDYKKKTAEIAAQRRDYDSALEKARLADLLSSDPDIVDLYNRKYVQAQQSQDMGSYQTDVDPASVKREVDVLKANLTVKDFKSSHPDFDELDSDGIITGYVQLNPPKSDRDQMTTLGKAYSYAKSLRDRWREDGRKEGLARVQEKVQQSSLSPSSTSGQVYSGDPKQLSVAEAVAMARKGIRINH